MMTGAGRRLLDQLRLLRGDKKLPWDGRSPRCLTRAHQTFRLESQDDDVNTDFDEQTDEQYRRFHNGW